MRCGLGIVLLAGSVSAMEPFPSYPGAVATRIGNPLVVANQRVQLVYFVTADAVSTVARHYLKAWARLGYPTLEDGDDTEAVVTAFLTREGSQRSVVMQRHSGQTLVFVAEKDLWSREFKVAQGAPLEGTLFAQDVRNLDGEVESTWVLEGTVSDTQTRVEARLRSTGFRSSTVQRAAAAGTARILEHVQGARHVTTALSDLGGGVTAVFQVERTETKKGR